MRVDDIEGGLLIKEDAWIDAKQGCLALAQAVRNQGESARAQLSWFCLTTNPALTITILRLLFQARNFYASCVSKECLATGSTHKIPCLSVKYV